MTTPATRASLTMWRVMLDADAVDYRAAAHSLLELAERLAAEGEGKSAGIEILRDFATRACAELSRHGWGDFHYSNNSPQEPAIVALLAEAENLGLPLSLDVAGLRAATVPGTEGP